MDPSAPLMGGKIPDALLGELQTFALKQLKLQARVRLADQQLSSGAYDAVPGYAFSAWASSHGASGSACAPGEFQGFRDLTVGRDAPAGDGLYQLVYKFPIHRIRPIDFGVLSQMILQFYRLGSFTAAYYQSKREIRRLMI